MRVLLMKGFLLLLLSVLSVFSYGKTITVTDIKGREVTLNVPVKKVYLADSRDLLSLDIAAGSESFAAIAGWSDSLGQYAPDMEQAYFSRFPALKNIPAFKNKGNSSVDVEALIQLRPDVVIDNAKHYTAMNEAGVIDKLAQAGIAVVFIDYKNNPLEHTPKAIELLGQLFDQQARASAFNDYYQQHINSIQSQLQSLNSKPSVLLERHAGLMSDSCCNLFGRLSYGELASRAGANNLQTATDNGGDASIENILHLNPDYYVMTGANWTRYNSSSVAVKLGYNADKATVEKQLKALTERTGINTLRAVRTGHVMAIYHHFYDNPLNFLAIEAMAKFFHPEAFTRLDPVKNAQQVHEKFTSIPGDGIFWITR